MEVRRCPYCGSSVEWIGASEITERDEYACTDEVTCGEEFSVIRLLPPPE